MTRSPRARQKKPCLCLQAIPESNLSQTLEAWIHNAGRVGQSSPSTFLSLPAGWLRDWGQSSASRPGNGQLAPASRPDIAHPEKPVIDWDAALNLRA